VVIYLGIRENRQRFEAVIEEGCTVLISEFCMLQPPHDSNPGCARDRQAVVNRHSLSAIARQCLFLANQWIRNQGYTTGRCIHSSPKRVGLGGAGVQGRNAPD
jgi:hypothetical protein